MCQIENVYEMDSTDFLDYVKERFLYFLRNPIDFMAITIKRLKRYNNSKIVNVTSHKKYSDKKHTKKLKNTSLSRFQEGDIVRIRSKEEIKQTLDKNNKLEGCGFMDEMWQYCGTQQKIIKKVDYFYDELNSRMCKARNIVLLEDVYCSGIRKSKQNCDRMCFIFWKEDWLERIG